MEIENQATIINVSNNSVQETPSTISNTNVPPPSPKEGSVVITPKKYAGFWVRVAALLIDGLVLGAIGFILILFIKEPTIRSLVYIIISWLYAVFMITEYQATLGKMVVGLHVEKTDGGRVTLRQAFLREIIGKFISSIIIGIGYLMVAWTEKKQGLHDKIAGTVVLENNPNKSKTVWVVLAVLVMLTIPIIGISSSIILASLNVARNQGKIALIKSIIMNDLSEAIIYYDTNNSYKGFVPQPKNNTPACSDSPIVNISNDGKSLAIFMKSCLKETEYYCMADDESKKMEEQQKDIITVPKSKMESGASSCEN